MPNLTSSGAASSRARPGASGRRGPLLLQGGPTLGSRGYESRSRFRMKANEPSSSAFMAAGAANGTSAPPTRSPARKRVRDRTHDLRVPERARVRAPEARVRAPEREGPEVPVEVRVEAGVPRGGRQQRVREGRGVVLLDGVRVAEEVRAAPRHDDVQGPLGRRAEARGPEGNHGVLLGLLPAEPGRVAGRARRRGPARRAAPLHTLAPAPSA